VPVGLLSLTYPSSLMALFGAVTSGLVGPRVHHDLYGHMELPRESFLPQPSQLALGFPRARVSGSFPPAADWRYLHRPYGFSYPHTQTLTLTLGFTPLRATLGSSRSYRLSLFGSPLGFFSVVEFLRMSSVKVHQ
jgi:hypothetical protein